MRSPVVIALVVGLRRVLERKGGLRGEGARGCEESWKNETRASQENTCSVECL